MYAHMYERGDCFCLVLLLDLYPHDSYLLTYLLTLLTWSVFAWCSTTTVKPLMNQSIPRKQKQLYISRHTHTHTLAARHDRSDMGY